MTPQHLYRRIFFQLFYHHHQQQKKLSSNYYWLNKQNQFVRHYYGDKLLSSSNNLINLNCSVVTEEHQTSYKSLISHQEIRQRQRNLVQLLYEHLQCKQKDKTTTSIVVLISTPPPHYQATTQIPVNECKDNSDFTYLTGMHSGTSDQLTNNCLLLIYIENSNDIDDSHRSILFYTKRRKNEIQWNGPDISVIYQDWLKQICDDHRPLNELTEFLNQHLKKSKYLFISKKTINYRPELITNLKFYLKSSNDNNDDDDDMNKWSTTFGKTIQSINVVDVSMFIDKLRVIKSSQELRAMKRIGMIGSLALNNTIEWSRTMFNHQINNSPSSFKLIESHIDAKFNLESKLLGARQQSFPSVCASGPRTTIIHYGRNDHIIDDDNCWILTDVGCQDVDGYCCDISRTWPIKLNNDDRCTIRLQLYEALIEIEQNLINAIHVGHTSLDDLNQLMLKMMVKLLKEFKVFNDTAAISNKDINDHLVRRLCPHHVSHYLGLDIHDTPTVSRSTPLLPGMCFTIEPGLYFPAQTTLPIKRHFRDIGIRIEDDFMIEHDRHLIVPLTENCSKII